MSRTAQADDSSRIPPTALTPAVPGSRREHLVWTGLNGDSLPLAVASTVQQHNSLVVVITPDMQAAERLHDQVFFFAGRHSLPVMTFPDWETLPYDSFSPHPDIVSERLATLYTLPEQHRGLLIVAAPTLLQRLPPREYIYQNSLILKTGDTLNLDAMRTRLEGAGYRCVSQVMEHGEFAVRGSLLDLYPMGNPLPFRIDLFDNEIESIRTFDTETQCSLETLKSIRMLPAREFPLDEAAIRNFRQRFRARFEGDPQNCAIYRDVSNGIAPAGIEYYLPLFLDETCTLFDYLPADACILQLDSTGSAGEKFQEQLQERYEARRHNIERPLLPPELLFLEAAELQQRLDAYMRIDIDLFRGTKTQYRKIDYAVRVPGDLRLRPRGEQPAAALQAFIAGFNGRILITAESSGRREALRDQLRAFAIRPEAVNDWDGFLDSGSDLCLTVAPLEQGLILGTPQLAVITETGLFGDHARQTRRRKPSRDPASIVRNLTNLEINAPVVHEEHGVGRYLGLETLKVGDIETEYLAIAYAGNDKLYVPVASLALVSRYTGASPEHAPLHKLGSDQWEKARRKATRRIHDVAVELLDIHARRAARKGHAFGAPAAEYASFASTFPFEETPDQEDAIHVVLADMQSSMPMDRLVCGDVGFGKTEVAMRAAFLAVQDGKQVALLVPTTLLAQQHYQNFCDRFSDWPVRIEMLSRFRSGKQQDEILAALQSGAIDIVVGTHRLLQPAVKFRNLGLLIIDEEHRFGVRQKESIKRLRAEIDILTLTATPIPRTLNMSLSGMRDLSIISTPPPNRLAVKTFVCEWDKETIREACLREIKRGGQVYFLHNDVASIERMAKELGDIVPEAHIEIAHGQMRERELEKVMLDFYHRRFNVLLCSTIVESGIDVPTANTIIMNRADKLGLAQLHQLRGRVGRSHHRAYAYLLIPSRRSLSADAEKRLAAVESMEELGAGFTIATHDLEIRGAGELLGEDQSGQIHEIGFSLYTDLLERAVKALKEGRTPDLDRPLHQGPEIDLSVPALIPADYLHDVHTRLVLYKRIAGMETEEQLRELQVEMIDRFGLLPDAVKNLFRIAALKLLATPMGIRKIEIGSEEGRILFDADPAIDTDRLIELIQSQPQHYRLDGATRLRLYGDFHDEENRFARVSELLMTLAPKTH
ncbi:MAG: transcription-repair coupling factor [Gammaproteobacteria bacterium]|jgi:transcription-repair coupling factor (superfamily II helicase)|nr:transcription-repair coupling factor [Gammaproteobacteria bacterium]